MARARWAKAKARIAHRRLLFIDESGAKTNMTRLYGRGPRGERVYDQVPNGRWETTTMIAAIGRNGAQAPWVLDGCASQVFVRNGIIDLTGSAV